MRWGILFRREITLTYATNATTRLVAEYTQERLKQVLGITVKVESMEMSKAE